VNEREESLGEGLTIGGSFRRQVSECVAVCCSVLQCVAMFCSVLQCVVVRCIMLQCVTMCCCVLQCVAVCCSVLQSHGSYISRVLCRDRTREKIGSSRRDGKSSVIFLLYLKSCLH